MPQLTQKARIALAFSFFIDALLLDQLSKILLDANLQAPYFLPGNFFGLRIEHNTGIAFSISVPYPLLIVFNLLFFGGIIYYLLKTLNLQRFSSLLIIALLAAGAMGNLIDRIRLGYVIDFISVGSFPVFNFADSFITVAIFLLLLFYDKIKRPN